jgi:membrane protease subunit HflC
MRASQITLLILALAVLIVILSATYVVNETEQVIITQFGKPVGDPVTSAGLHFKIPFIQKANSFDKRWLEWDGDANQIPTKDKKYIWVDTFARWRIADPLLYFQRVRDETGAQSRLDDILDGETRDIIASYNLIELVRSSNRPFELIEELKEFEDLVEVEDIQYGRKKIVEDIQKGASQVTLQYGIELLDIRIKRINYVENVQSKVFDRMISERKRIAEKYRSEGHGRSAEIRGEKERELKRITSEAYRKAQELVGEADGEATVIYASAYNKDPEFYRFLKTLETYKNTIDSESWIVMSTDSDFYRLLKTVDMR